VSSDIKEEDTSRMSDDLLLSQQSHPKEATYLITSRSTTANSTTTGFTTTANSTTTGFTKYSAVSVSTIASSTLSAGNGTNIFNFRGLFIGRAKPISDAPQEQNSGSSPFFVRAMPHLFARGQPMSGSTRWMPGTSTL